MMKSYLFFLLTLLLLAATATAQPELVQDGMGIFFDTEATTYCLDYEPIPGYTTFTAYLLLTNASTDQPILAWEARLEVDGNPTIPIPMCWVLHDGNPPWYCESDYIVNITNNPLVITNSVTVVASYTLGFLGTEIDPWCTYSVGRVTGSTTFPTGPGYTSEVGHPIECNPIVGTWGETSAWINHPDGPCDVVANEPMTWGAVKNLYDN